MKLVWHLAKSDLRRLRWPLVVWALAVVVNVVCNAYQLTLPPRNQWLSQLVDFGNLVSTVTRWGLTIALAAQLIQADPLHSTTAFWLTRPIGGGRLLAAKAVALTALALLPALLDASLVTSFGLSGRTWLAALLACGSTGAVVVVVAAAYATVAETFGSFILRGIILLAAGSVGASFASALVLLNRMAEGELGQPASLEYSGLWAFKIAALAGGAGFMIWRYRQRHVRFGLAIAGLGTLLIMSVPLLWPWDFFGGREVSRPTGDTPPALTLRSPVLRASATYRTSTMLAGEIECVARPDGTVLEPMAMRRDVLLRWSDGRSQTAARAYVAYPPTMDLAGCEPAALQRFLAPWHLLDPPPKNSWLLSLVNLDRATAQQLSREPARLRADVTAILHRFVVEAEIPVSAGAAARGRAWNMRIVTASVHGGAVHVVLAEDVYISPLAGEQVRRRNFSAFAFPIASLPPPPPPVFYLLVNRARSEALLPRIDPSGAFPQNVAASSTRGRAAVRVANFGDLYAMREQMEFPVAGPNRDATDWLQGATLLRVRLEDLGLVTCTLKAEGVTAKL